jgi:hypothetical protein
MIIFLLLLLLMIDKKGSEFIKKKFVKRQNASKGGDIIYLQRGDMIIKKRQNFYFTKAQQTEK